CGARPRRDRLLPRALRIPAPDRISRRAPEGVAYDQAQVFRHGNSYFSLRTLRCPRALRRGSDLQRCECSLRSPIENDGHARRRPEPAVRQWRVEPNRYVLYVSRLEPENNAHLVIEAFKKVRTAHKLLIIGDAPYAHEYIKELRERAGRDRRIIFTGFVFGKDY